MKATGRALKAERAQETHPSCPRCHMIVPRYAPQVIENGQTYHRECYEAWYVGRHGRRPGLVRTAVGGHVFAPAGKGAGA